MDASQAKRPETKSSLSKLPHDDASRNPSLVLINHAVEVISLRAEVTDIAFF
jgi:hypothetical protein